MKKGVSLFLLVVLIFVTVLLFINLTFADVYQPQTPSTNTFTNQQEVNFTVNVSITENHISNLTNISLWLGQSAPPPLNSTNSTNVTTSTEFTYNNTFYSLVLTLNEGVYNWTFSITFNNTHTLINTTNHTLTVDLTNPTASLVLPVTGNYSGDLLFNASSNDTLSGVVNVSYGYDRPGYAIAWFTGVTDAIQVGTWNATLDTTSLSDGKWNVSVNATDTAGNQNITSNITEIVVDNNAPNASFTVPINNSNVSGSVLLNATVNDTGTGVMAVAFGYQNSTSDITWINATEGASGFWNSTINFSELVETIYNLSINATDYLNNSKLIYNLTFFTFDVTPPAEAPTLVAVNVSDSDNDGNIEINWSDIDDETAETYIVYRFHSFINASLGLNGSLVNITTNRVAEGVMTFEDNTTLGTNTTGYWYAVVAVDSAGNLNTPTRAVNLSLSFNSTANDTISPKPVTGLNLTVSGATVTLRWRSVTQDITNNADANGLQYKVYRSGANANVNASRYTYVNMTDSNFGITTLAGTYSTNYTTYTATTNGTYHFIVTSIDDNNNENKSFLQTGSNSNFGNITLTVSPASDDLDSGSGGGGGGGGGGTVADPDAGVSQSRSWDAITSGSTVTFNITKTTIPFTAIKFKVTEAVADVELTVTKLSSKPSSVSAYDGTIYNYLSVRKTNLKDTALSSVIIDFKVERKWFTANNGLAKNIVLLRYDRDRWNELPLEMISLDVNNAYYRAESPGMSTFAIALKKVAADDSDDEIKTLAGSGSDADTNVSQDLNESAAPGELPKGKALLYTAILIIVVALLAGGAGFFYYRKNKGLGGGSEESEESTPPEKPEETPKV